MSRRNIKKEIKSITFIIIIAVAGLLLFIRSAGFEFVWDDNPLYLNKANYPSKNEFGNISKFWTPAATPMFAPVTYTAWALIGSISPESQTNDLGRSPFLFHLANVLLHILNSILVFIIINTMLKNRIAAFGAALIFLVHPIAVESVSWISEFRGLLSALFGFLSIFVFLKYSKDDTSRKEIKSWIILSFLFILSFLSKPTGIVFPLIIIILDLFDNKALFKNRSKRFFIPVFLLLIFFFISINSEANASAVTGTPVFLKILLPFFTFIFYLIKFLIPIDLSAVYGLTPAYLESSILIYIYPAFFVILLFFSILLRGKLKFLIVGLLVAFISGLPTSGIVPYYYQTFSTVADRYFYIPMLGISIAVGFLLIKIKTERTTFSIIISVALILSYFTYNQQSNWKTEFSHWNNVITKSKIGIPQAYMGRGEELIKLGRYDESIADFTNAIRLNPKEGLYYYNRGNAYLDLKQYEKAITDYTRSIKYIPGHTATYINRGMAYTAIDNNRGAIADYQKAIQINPNQVEALNYIGVIYAQSSIFDSAVVYFKKALSVSPNDEQASENLKMAESEMLKGK